MDKALPSNLKEFVDESLYQQIVEEMLTLAKKAGAHQAEVGSHASIGLNVTVRMGEVETLEFNRDKAIGITVYIENRKGSASTTDISPASLKSTVEAAILLAKLTEADPFSGLADKAEMAEEIKPLDLYHPWDIQVSEAIQLAKLCEHNALNLDKRINNSEGATINSAQGYHVYGNSHGFLGYYPTSRHGLSCTIIAQDAQGMERDYEYTVSRLRQGLASPIEVGKKAAEKAISRLSAKKLPTQRVPVIFQPQLAAGLIGQFITAISGGRLFRKSSFLLDSLNTKIFPDFMQIDERPHIIGGIASSPFDNDGVATTDKNIVVDGIVNSYILSAYSARKLNLANTGNAGGIHNVFVKPNHGDLKALCQKMNRGLLAMELMGQGINLVTGDYSRGVSGFWVENGQIQYPVHEVTIAGNMLNMFRQIAAVGNDIDERGSIKTGSILIEEMTLAGV